MLDLSSIGSRDFYVASHCSVHGWGGGLAVAADLDAALARRGHTTLLLGVGADECARGGADPMTARVNLPVRSSGRLWRVGNWLAPRAMSNALRRLEPPRLAFLTVSPTWVLAAKRCWPDVPVVFVFPCLLSNCLPFTWRRRRPTMFWGRVNHTGIRRTEHLAFSLADLILTPTRQARDEVLAFHRGSRERVAVYVGGFAPAEVAEDQRRSRRESLGLGDDAVVILVAGVCDLNKAVDWAVRELPAVEARGHLVIVGEGPERPRLARLAAELDVGWRVHVLGKQPAVEPWHAAADCVVSTSYYDTFPATIKEGMSRGRPAVVPRHAPPKVYAGIAEVIDEEGGGLVYERTRAGALAECLNRLIRNPHTRAELGRQALSISARRSGWESVVEHVLSVCAERSPSTDDPSRGPHAARDGERAERQVGAGAGGWT